MTDGLLGSLELRLAAPASNPFYPKFLDALDRARDGPADILAPVTDGLAGAVNKTTLETVNARVNAAAPYRGDGVAFGSDDYWAAPHEFFGKGGDCEDFAIAKFLALESLGFTDMRLVIAEDGTITHALLAVWLAGKVWMLDNRQDAFTSHEHLLKYKPVFSCDRKSAWAHIVTPEIRAAFVENVSNA